MPERRRKAQDVFRESTPFFGEKTSFEEAYPTVGDLKVKVTEQGDGVYGGSSTSAYGKERASEYVNCSNPALLQRGLSSG